MTKTALTEIQKRLKFLKDCHSKLLLFKRNEFCTESFLQFSLRLVMVAIFFTNTSTTSGLQTVFKEDINLVLIFQTLWSFVSVVRTFVKIKKEKKDGPIPMIGTILLHLRACLSLISRLTCILVYLTPYLGLLNILYHLKGESLPYRPTEKQRTDSDPWAIFNDTNN